MVALRTDVVVHMDFTVQMVQTGTFATENPVPRQHISTQKRFVTQSMRLFLLSILMKILNTTLTFRKSKFPTFKFLGIPTMISGDNGYKLNIVVFGDQNDGRPGLARI